METIADPIENLLRLIEPQWRRHFRNFVERGDADPDFLRYMDSSADCQAAIEQAFEIKSAGMAALQQALTESSEPAPKNTPNQAMPQKRQVGVA